MNIEVNLKDNKKKISIFIASALTVLFVFFLLGLIFRLRSSTAALGLMVVPVYAFIFYFLSYWFVLSIVQISRNLSRKVEANRHTVYSSIYLTISLIFGLGFIYSFDLETKAKYSSLSVEYANRLYESQWAKLDKYVKLGLAANKTTPPDILRKLYSDPFAEDVDKLYGLRPLMSEDYRSLKARLAGNENTPKSILTKLGNENNWYIQKGLALNKNTPEDVLEILKNRGDIYIKKIIENRKQI